jgi:hypothetical protein
MQAHLGHEMDRSIDWEDSRAYGGTEDFQMQEWEAEPGYEVSLPTCGLNADSPFITILADAFSGWLRTLGSLSTAVSSSLPQRIRT